MLPWLFSTYDIERCYDTKKNYNLERACKRKNGFDVDYIICHFPSTIDRQLAPKDKSIIRAMVWIKSTDRNIQEYYKENLYEKIIIKLNEIIPNVQRLVEIKEIAVPNTLNKFTSNWNGAAFGWASTVKQIDINNFPSKTSIEGLYLAGHWVTNGIGHSGIPLVAFCGRNVAKLLIKHFENINLKSVSKIIN